MHVLRLAAVSTDLDVWRRYGWQWQPKKSGGLHLVIKQWSETQRYIINFQIVCLPRAVLNFLQCITKASSSFLCILIIDIYKKLKPYSVHYELTAQKSQMFHWTEFIAILTTQKSVASRVSLHNCMKKTKNVPALDTVWNSCSAQLWSRNFNHLIYYRHAVVWFVQIDR